MVHFEFFHVFITLEYRGDPVPRKSKLNHETVRSIEFHVDHKEYEPQHRLHSRRPNMSTQQVTDMYSMTPIGASLYLCDTLISNRVTTRNRKSYNAPRRFIRIDFRRTFRHPVYTYISNQDPCLDFFYLNAYPNI